MHWSEAVSNFIGYQAVVLGFVQKIPQIYRVWNMQSIESLSIISLYAESLYFITTIMYYYTNDYKLTTYGVFIPLYVANTVLLHVIYWVSDNINIKTTAILSIKMVIFAIAFSKAIPISIIAFIFKWQIIIILYSRLPQIWEIYKVGVPGSVSILTRIMTVGNFCARFFSIYVEIKDDWWPLINCGLNIVFNSVIVFQIFYYWYIKPWLMVKLKMNKSMNEKIVGATLQQIESNSEISSQKS